MSDVFTKEKRSEVMSKIRSKDTTIEMKLRRNLWKKGYRYRVHYKTIGSPDIAFPKEKIAIFVDGCFWHKCPICYRKPKSNKDYWIPKIKKNCERDKKNTKYLEKKGWMVIRIWEHEIRKNLNDVVKKIENNLGKK